MQINSVSNMPVGQKVGQTQANISQSGNGEVAKIPRPVNKGESQSYKEDKAFSEQEAIDIIEKANKEFVAYDRKFEFSIHEKTKQIMVKVIDATTDEVIRELPPEKILDMVAAIWEVAGIIVDKKI